MATIVLNYSANDTFIIPLGVDEIIVEVWGGGAGASQNGSPGGGGGGYAKATVSVIQRDTYTITVGAGGPGGAVGSAGEDSYVSDPVSTVIARAQGGQLGAGSTGGTGGVPDVGDVLYNGGNGGDAVDLAGGGGGGGAGISGAGGNGSGATGGTAGSAESSAGGAGGADGVNGTSASGGYGGGGGGGGSSSTSGGDGAIGHVRITYDTPPFGCVIVPAETNDDGYYHPNGPVFDNTSSSLNVGDDGIGNFHSTFIRFSGCPIPQLANISEANLILRVVGATGVRNISIQFCNENNSAQMADEPDAAGRALTVASTGQITYADNVLFYTFNCADALQQVVNRGSYASGNFVQAIIKGSGELVSFASTEDTNPGGPPVLVASYTPVTAFNNFFTCFIQGNAASTTGITLYTHQPTGSNNNNITLYTEGYLPSETGFSLYTQGFGLSTGNIPLSILSEFTPYNDNRTLYTYGSLGRETGIPITLFGYISSETGIPLFLLGHDVGENNIPLFIRGHIPEATGFTLYLNQPTGENSDGFSLIINGTEISNENITLYTHGDILSTGSLPLILLNNLIDFSGYIPLYTNSHIPNETGIPLVVGGHIPSESGFTLYLHQPTGSAENNFPLVIRGLSSETGAFTLYTEGVFADDKPLTLYMKGRETTTVESGRTLFVQVSEIGSGYGMSLALPLLIHSPSFWQDISLFIKSTGESQSHVMPCYINGSWISAENSLPLFVMNSGDMNYIPLYISGHGFGGSENAQRSRDGFIPYEQNVSLFINRPITDVMSLFIGDTYNSGTLGLFMSANPYSETGVDLTIKGLGYLPAGFKLYTHGW
jgi:hypothetical protein